MIQPSLVLGIASTRLIDRLQPNLPRKETDLLAKVRQQHGPTDGFLSCSSPSTRRIHPQSVAHSKRVSSSDTRIMSTNSMVPANPCWLHPQSEAKPPIGQILPTPPPAETTVAMDVSRWNPPRLPSRDAERRLLGISLSLISSDYAEDGDRSNCGAPNEKGCLHPQPTSFGSGNPFNHSIHCSF